MKKLILFALSTNLIFSQINPENIDIVRDNYGVPHIFAKTDAEASIWSCVGYVPKMILKLFS